MQQWTDPQGVRIWRMPAQGTCADDVLNSAEYYTDAALAELAGAGFTGIWVFAELYNLMRSSVFPELNRAGAEERVAALQVLIDRARRHGIGVYLYFNEPMGIANDHPFWTTHPELRGAEKWRCYALCTSTPAVQAFFRQALESVFADLRALAGVILITGSEGLTNCWSKHTTRPGDPPPACPRCSVREPAEVVLELLHIWADVSRNHPTPFRVLAWNWEWVLWYPDPQLPLTAHLPAGVELLLGYEMGGTRTWHDRTIYVGEYALSFPGPAQQFLDTCAVAAEHGIPVHAKIELSNTHEMCSVPNLPVLRTLHGRFVTLTAQAVAGIMYNWTMSGRFSLNTFAMQFFLRDPARFMAEDVFLDALATEYFGCPATDGVVHAWRQFSDAFTEYPFCVQALYNGPHNDAPARLLSLHFTGTPIGRSYMNDALGDDLSRLVGDFFEDRQSFTLDELIDGFRRLGDAWEAGIPSYAAALEADDAGITDAQRRHRHEELGCARMIGIQVRSVVNVLRFFQAQQRAMQTHGLTAPCEIPPDDALATIMAEEIANITAALPLLDADPRLGYHQDTGGYKYNAEMVRAKIQRIEAELAHITVTR